MEFDPEPMGAIRRLLKVFLEDGRASLTHASLRTGYFGDELAEARDYLLREGLIRPVPGQEGRDPELVNYELNV